LVVRAFASDFEFIDDRGGAALAALSQNVPHFMPVIDSALQCSHAPSYFHVDVVAVDERVPPKLILNIPFNFLIRLDRHNVVYLEIILDRDYPSDAGSCLLRAIS
jgi:hypothetical protein